MKHVTTPEVMLALRSPDSGWLGVLACVIDEASRDPQFDHRQRQLAITLLESGPLSSLLATAARRRAARFEAELDNVTERPRPDDTRPKLTLVGQ